MSDCPDLERRYRRLLSLYPKAFRRERGREILTVLMEGARPGQQRPRRREAADLARHALPMRMRQIIEPCGSERRHPGPWILARTLIGLWQVIVTALLCQTGHWWGLAVLAASALQFFLAYRLAAPLIERERGAGGPSSRAMGG